MPLRRVANMTATDARRTCRAIFASQAPRVLCNRVTLRMLYLRSVRCACNRSNMTANVALLRSEHDKALATEQRRTAAIEATYRRRIDELQVRSRATGLERRLALCGTLACYARR